MHNDIAKARSNEELQGPSVHSEPLACACCGRPVRDTSEENVWHGLVPSPGDAGRGLCRRCGGDPRAKAPRDRLGWALSAFVEARVPLIAARLSPKNRARFLAMSLEEQAAIVEGLVKKGTIS